VVCLVGKYVFLLTRPCHWAEIKLALNGGGQDLNEGLRGARGEGRALYFYQRGSKSAVTSYAEIGEMGYGHCHSKRRNNWNA
jgi:hypothetical protein